MVTGFFQKLHQGHIALLKRAKETYLPVIVLLNGDQAKKALNKLDSGEDFLTRKKNLLETTLVDKVFWLYIDPTRWIKLIRPRNLVVGDDHTKDEVLKKGGIYAKNIIIFKKIPGISSTKIIKELKDDRFR